MLFSTHPTYYPSKFMLILTRKKIKTKKSIRKKIKIKGTQKKTNLLSKLLKAAGIFLNLIL